MTITVGRMFIAILSPFAALLVQWFLWSFITPYVWFCFFPAVFFSARIGGFWGGITSTFLSTAIVWYFFIPPQLSWSVARPENLYSVGMFLLMGYLFSDSHERLNKANKMLAEALSESKSAKDEIMRLYEQTRELDKLKSHFFANVSHELRTPLTLILGPVHTIIENNELPDNIRQSLKVVERNARFLYRHVVDLLDISKLESNKMILQYAEVDIAHLTNVIVSQFEILAQSRHIRLSVHIPDKIPAQADGEKVQRILLNLLSNAFKFTPDGGEIQLKVEVVDNQAMLCIQDNGIGIPPDLYTIIFERFRQVQSDAARSYGGTGLGLSIVKEFTELHKGTIEVGESPGGGALFVVRLPLKAPEGTNIMSEPGILDKEVGAQAIDELRMDKERPENAFFVSNRSNAPLILVVEDNPDMNKYIVSLLSGDYHVATAFDGQEGVLKARNLQPDLILSDIMMPKMSGDKMVMELREHQDTASIPILLLSAKYDDDLRLLMLKTGVKDYIVKPFFNEELLVRIDRLIVDQLQYRNTQAKLDAIVESSEDAIIGLTNNGIVISWNQGAQRLFGYSSDEKTGTSILEIFSLYQQDEYKQALYRIDSGNIMANFETVFNRGEKGSLFASIFIFYVRDFRKRITGISMIIRDITKQKIIEGQNKTILAISVDGFWMLDMEGKIVQVNESYCNMIGYTQAELLNMRINDIEALESPDDTKKRIKRVMESGGDLFESKHKCKNGRIIDVEVSANFITSDNLIFSFIRNITERKLIEEEIKNINQDLQKRVEEELAKNRIKDQLMYEQSRHISMGELLVNISHHWRQPLCAIALSVQDIRDAYTHNELDETYLDNNIELAMSELKTLSDIIDNFRNFYYEKEQREFNISDEINKANALISGYVQEKAIVIEKELDESLTTQGRPSEFAQVILNILTNAKDNFERINLTGGIIKIHLYKDASTGRKIISITDNGGGVPEDIIDKVFDPYFTTKDKSRGTGMGLYMAKIIIEKNMNGTISISNIDGLCELRIEL
ncbi:MAG: PAS domain S-box protein [Nitrospirae bacterium]|nr:PAS domain S-box protein [Nitrospirota bacterium]